MFMVEAGNREGDLKRRRSEVTMEPEIAAPLGKSLGETGFRALARRVDRMVALRDSRELAKLAKDSDSLVRREGIRGLLEIEDAKALEVLLREGGGSGNKELPRTLERRGRVRILRKR